MHTTLNKKSKILYIFWNNNYTLFNKKYNILNLKKKNTMSYDNIHNF